MVAAEENEVNQKAFTNTELFLGVDGGGTKTHVVVINGQRTVLAEAVGGPSNPVLVGIEDAAANISETISNVCDTIEQYPSKLTAATLGLAGVRRDDLKTRIRERIIDNLRIKHVEVTTDAEIALFGAVQTGAGLVVIAGTGSICLGKNSLGEIVSAGGWGPLAGDEGGASGISRTALRAIAKASDGRGRATILTAKAMDYFRAGKPDDLVMAIYARNVDNSRIAGFAKFVAEAAQDGDRVASEIMNDAGREIGLAANAVIRRLQLAEQKFPIAKVGGVFNAQKLITISLMATVHKEAPDAFLIDPALVPAVAAAHLAIKSAELL